jgi:hypothetical protein
MLSVGESRGVKQRCFVKKQPRCKESVIPHMFDDPDEAPCGFISPGITSVWYRTAVLWGYPLTV